jgi:hypothetical protein
MKRVIMVCFMLIVPGLSSFGLTNAVPPMVQSSASPKQQEQKAVPKPKTAGAPSEGTVSHGSEIPPAQVATFHRIKEGGLLTPQKTTRDVGAMLDGLFPSEDKGVIVIIFPTGR